MAILGFPKWCELLSAIDDCCVRNTNTNYTERLIREMDMSLSHLKTCLKAMEGAGLIERVQDKNKKYIYLTPAGKDIAEYYRQMRSRLGSRGERP